MLKRLSLQLYFLLIIATLLCGRAMARGEDHGLRFKSERYQGHRYISVEIDLNQANLTHHMANPKTGKNYVTFGALRQLLRTKGEALLFAINSGIYTKEYKPLGLHIEEGAVLSPLNLVTSNRGQGNFSLLPNGVFFLTERNRAEILDTDRFHQRFKGDYQGIKAAVQSGPMLIINGEFNPYFFPESESYRIRSGVCAQDQGRRVIFVVTEDNVNFYEFARFFKEELHCQNALYLDGTLARIYFNGRTYGASFWQSKPLVGIWSVIRPS